MPILSHRKYPAGKRRVGGELIWLYEQPSLSRGGAGGPVVRIGVVGAGGVMQRVHLPSLRKLGGVEVVAMAELNRALGQRVATAFGIPRVYGSAEELVAQEALDGVVVIAGKPWHAAACMPALERGLPVFTEKPLAATIEDGRRMVETARRTGARLMVGYMKRYDPAYLEAARLLREGALGEVRFARIHDFGGVFVAGAEGVGTLALHPPDGTPRPRPAQPAPATPEETRRRMFDNWIEVWIHDVYVMRGLFGDVREIIWSRAGSPKLALARCGSGTEVLLEMGGPQIGGAPWDESVEAFGTQGRFTLRFKPPFLLHAPSELVVESPRSIDRPRLGFAEAFTEEMRHFCRMIAEGGQPETDGAMGLEDMEICSRLVDAALGA